MRKSRRLMSLCAATGLMAGGLFATTTTSATARPAGTPQPLSGFLIVSWMNNRCLDISGANQWNGAVAQMWDCNGSPQQQWHVG